jgi:2-phospho-L-lactate guanylyltransferase
VTSRDRLQWTVLVPIKTAPSAKSRLAATLPESARGRHQKLVRAMRLDVLSAARIAPGVARVVVVADGEHDYPADHTARQHRAGLNGALADGAEYAAARWPADGIVALVGDLPALTPADLGAALESAASHAAAYVPDADGTGTTLLSAAPGATLRPEFGPGSARRHGRHAVSIEAGPGLRRDVDTADDLVATLHLGAGPATTDAAADTVLGVVTLPRSPRGVMMTGMTDRAEESR